MRRSPHPLAGALRRGLFGRDRRSEVGDTLIEILVTITILGGCAVALIITFATAITASADHRSLVSNATVLRNSEQQAYYQLALQPTPDFQPCATTSTYTSGTYAVSLTAPTGYAAAISPTIPVAYWDATQNTFGSSCLAPNAPQLITLNVTNPHGKATTQFVVDGPGVAPTPFNVTGVSPPTASQGSSNLLLTITGVGFVSGAKVTFSTALITEPGPVTFVSSTTLNVFVNIAASPSLSAATPYTVTVTNPSGATATGTFTVIPVTHPGMHVSNMQPNIGEPVPDDPDENATIGWDAWDTITVVSGSGAPLQGVVVSGAWSPTADIVNQNIVTCTTDSTGTCTVYDGYPDKLKNVTPTFTVSNLVLSPYVYTSGANTPGALTISAP
jgi:type II secretory pathway pseudopilin PulG